MVFIVPETMMNPKITSKVISVFPYLLRNTNLEGTNFTIFADKILIRILIQSKIVARNIVIIWFILAHKMESLM